ncbi:RTC4-like domain-containing protein [Pyronema omphalodes]|nr:RTC4-like domain-containing protein [Pyronema omphalodes]
MNNYGPKPARRRVGQTTRGVKPLLGTVAGTSRSDYDRREEDDLEDTELKPHFAKRTKYNNTSMNLDDELSNTDAPSVSTSNSRRQNESRYTADYSRGHGVSVDDYENPDDIIATPKAPRTFSTSNYLGSLVSGNADRAFEQATRTLPSSHQYKQSTDAFSSRREERAQSPPASWSQPARKFSTQTYGRGRNTNGYKNPRSNPEPKSQPKKANTHPTINVGLGSSDDEPEPVKKSISKFKAPPELDIKPGAYGDPDRDLYTKAPKKTLDIPPPLKSKGKPVPEDDPDADLLVKPTKGKFSVPEALEPKKFQSGSISTDEDEDLKKPIRKKTFQMPDSLPSKSKSKSKSKSESTAISFTSDSDVPAPNPKKKPTKKPTGLTEAELEELAYRPSPTSSFTELQLSALDADITNATSSQPSALQLSSQGSLNDPLSIDPTDTTTADIMTGLGAIAGIRDLSELRRLHTLDESQETCRLCRLPLPTGYLEKWRGEAPNGIILLETWTKICRQHTRSGLEDEWNARGYPVIDWKKLSKRAEKYIPHLRRIIDGSKSSTLRQEFEQQQKEIRGNTAMLLRQERKLPFPGYYGPRGGDILLEIIMKRLGTEVGKAAEGDKLIARGGVSAFVQQVLVPETGIRLIMEDMGIRDQDKAKQVLEESREIGEKLWGSAEMGDLMDEGEGWVDVNALQTQRVREEDMDNSWDMGGY